MAMKIDADLCVSCGACEEACDINNAISQTDTAYAIDASKCDECKSAGGDQKCVPTCGVDAIVKA